MSILKRQVNSCLNFASFFFMTQNSSVNFKLIQFLLWTKGSHQSLNSDTFKCSGKNLPYFSCHFPNQVSFSSNLASLFSFMKDNYSVLFYIKRYLLCTKETNQSRNFKNFECSDQNSANSCHFWKIKSVFSSSFVSLFSVIRHNLSIIFSWTFTYFQQKEPIKV